MEEEQESVRYGRVPKRSRESLEESSRVTTSGESDQSSAEEMRSSPYFDLISTVSQAHISNCGYTDEHTQNLIESPLIFPPSLPEENGAASSTAEARERQRCWLWQHTAARITPCIQRLVEFAKRVPGFIELQQDDQLILLKLGFLEIWFCHVAKLTTDSSFMFEDGLKLSRQQMELMYDVDFVNKLVEFTRSFNSLQLNDEEIGLFSGVLLYNAERPGLFDVKTIETLQDRLIEAIKFQILRNHADEPKIYNNLLSKMQELKTLGTKFSVVLDWLRENWTKTSLPPLFAEIFDIPKGEPQ